MRKRFHLHAQIKKRKPNIGFRVFLSIVLIFLEERKGTRGSKAGSMGLIVSRMVRTSLTIEDCTVKEDNGTDSLGETR